MNSIIFWKWVLWFTPLIAATIMLVANHNINKIERISHQSSAKKTESFRKESLQNQSKIKNAVEQHAVDKKDINVAVENISFQKLIIFHTEVFKDTSQLDTFQLGAVIKLFNKGDKPYMIDGFSFNGLSFNISGGYGVFSKMILYEKKGELIENNYIKPYSEGYYKTLLPIQYQWSYLGLFQGADRPAPEFSLNGNWQIVFEKEKIQQKPRMSFHYETVISLQEWEALLKPKSAIIIEDINYKPEK